MARRSAIIRRRLAALALVVVASVASGTVFWTDQRRQAAAENEALDLAQRLALEQRRMTLMARQVLSAVARLPAVQRASTGGDCGPTLTRLLKKHPQFANFGVITPAGDLVCSATPLIHPVNLADRSCFRRAVAARDFAVGDYRLDPATGASTLTFGYPVLRRNGALDGVACAVLDASVFVALAPNERLPDGAALMVVDQDRQVLARYPGEAWPGARLVPHVPLPDTDSGSAAALVDPDGIERVYAFSRLYDAGPEAVYVGVGVPMHTGVDGVKPLLVFLLTLALLALTSVWAATDRGVVRRLHPLVDALRRRPIGQGADGVRASAQQAHLQRINRLLAARCSLHQALDHSSDEEALLRAATRVLVDTGAYAHAAIACAGAGAHPRMRVVAQSGMGDDLLAREIGHPITTALDSGRAVVMNDVAALLDPVHRHSALRRAAVLPLLAEDGVLGVLVVFATQADAFDAAELDLLADTAHDVARRIGLLRRRQRDALTGLPNVQRFETRLREAIAEPNASLALLFLDLDRFRDINDAFGFAQGDRLLKAVGDRCRGAMPARAFVARMHGDEFAVLLPDGRRDEAEANAKRLLDALEPALTLDGVAIDVRASIGIALYPDHGRSLDELVRHADIATRHAKRTESGYAFYARDHDRPTQFALASALHGAIRNDELVLHFQPKVDARSGRVIGAETLVRWQRPGHGLVLPGEFIALAERSGLIRPLTYWVLEECLRQCAVWRRAGLALPLAVNFSARTLLDPRFVQQVKALFLEHAVEPNWLQLELTESVLMERRQGDMDVLSQLRGLGVSLYIDDFGMGYSSFNYLKTLPVDAIKIDKSFVSEMLTDADSAFIVRAMIELAHGLDMQTVAEGVDTQAAWDRLRAIGCDAIQGFYVSEPLPADRFEAWLRAHTVVQL